MLSLVPFFVFVFFKGRCLKNRLMEIWIIRIEVLHLQLIRFRIKWGPVEQLKSQAAAVQLKQHNQQQQQETKR